MHTETCIDTISSPLPWPERIRVALATIAGDVVRSIDILARCGERARERRKLLSLDDRMLKDIGIGRAEAWAEADKPVWRD